MAYQLHAKAIFVEEQLWYYLTHKDKGIHPKVNVTDRAIGLMSRVFANGLRDWGSISGQVIPKTQKNGTWCLLA